mgnify:FL=1
MVAQKLGILKVPLDTLGKLGDKQTKTIIGSALMLSISVLGLSTITTWIKSAQMSNHYNEALLEQLFEEALDLGMSDAEAEQYAIERAEQLGDPS